MNIKNIIKAITEVEKLTSEETLNISLLEDNLLLEEKKINLTEEEMNYYLNLKSKLKLLEESFSDETREKLEEGWKTAQLKHTIKANLYLTFQKFKKKFNFNHNFNRATIKDINDKRLKDLVDSADSISQLESLIENLEKWISFAPKAVQDINTAKDAENIKNHNQAVIADVTMLNKKYLQEAKNKLKKLREEEKK